MSTSPTEVPRSLPRGRHSLEPQVVLLSQRARLMEGVVLAVAEKGYPATRVEDITRRAKVSRTTFYEQFADKEECFLTAYKTGADTHISHIFAAAQRASGWPANALAAVGVQLEMLTEQPAYAHAFLIEVHAAGPKALAARAEVYGRYADLLMAMHTEMRELREAEGKTVPSVPGGVFLASVAAADEVIEGYVREGKIDQLSELVPIVAYIHLALAGAPELAQQALNTVAD